MSDYSFPHYHDYYDDIQFDFGKVDNAEVQKIREDLRKNFPPDVREKIRKELEQDDAYQSSFQSFFTDRVFRRTYSESFWTNASVQQLQSQQTEMLSDVQDVDFGE